MSAPMTGTWPGFVRRVATPATPEQIATELADGWPAVVGGEISHGVLVACTAQIMLETGTRQDPNRDGVTTTEEQAPGFWNGNVGNIRGVYRLRPDDSIGSWTSFHAGEGSGKNQVFLEPGPDNKFRSYLGPLEDPTDPVVRRVAIRRGVRDFLSLLARKYPKALERAAEGDFRGYVHELHRGGYFTAEETSYARTEEVLEHTIETLPIIAAFIAVGAGGIRRS